MGPCKELSDAELICRTIDGDEDAFLVLYDRYAASLLAYVHKRTNNLDDVQTVVQETWLKASQHIGELREPEKFPRWMFRIAYQIIVNMHRENQKRIQSVSFSPLSDAGKALVNAAVIEHRNTEQQSENSDLQVDLRIAIMKLPDSERLPLLLQMDGMSYREIAQEMDITEGAVTNRLARAREKIKILILEMIEDAKPYKPSYSKTPEKSGGGVTPV